ncbi:MAG: PsbP-related protein, partial [Cyanobacteria bacterium P01_A01_bin.83]
SDIYALGMMAIFALTGIEPSLLFSDRHTGEIKWRDLAVVNPKLADIIDRMVRQDYRDRYQDATEAHQALTELSNQAIAKPLASPKLLSTKTILAATALLFALGSGYYFLQQPKTPLLLTYENTEYGIEVDYPDNWILEKVEDPFGTVARFYPEESQTENTFPLVTIEAINVDADLSLDDYNTEAISQIIKHLPEAKIINSRPIELNDKPAHRIVYTGKNKNSNVTNKYLQVWFKKVDKIFILTYVAPKDKYQDFSEAVEQIMIDSLVEAEVNN